MALYQPSQRLTWLYSSSTGQLSIVSELSVDLATNELVYNTVSSLRNDVAVITMTVNSLQASPMVITIPVEVIDTGLTNKDEVRGIIKTLPVFTVIATCYKNNLEVGEVINSTSASSEIEIVE